MTSNTSLLTRGDRLWATSQQKEENRAPWWGYNKRSAAGWYLGHPRKGEHQSDALTFQSTTIDNNSQGAFRSRISRHRAGREKAWLRLHTVVLLVHEKDQRRVRRLPGEHLLPR